RQWIHHLQRALHLLGLSPFDRSDLDAAQSFLQYLAGHSSALKERFAPMRQSIFQHSARFVDTFFHAREARLDLDFWLDAITKNGFRILGIFDRYAELDDLPNPLLSMPEAKAWQDRIADR